MHHAKQLVDRSWMGDYTDRIDAMEGLIVWSANDGRETVNKIFKLMLLWHFYFALLQNFHETSGRRAFPAGNRCIIGQRNPKLSVSYFRNGKIKQ
jgi:hypothetical protein